MGDRGNFQNWYYLWCINHDVIWAFAYGWYYLAWWVLYYVFGYQQLSGFFFYILMGSLLFGLVLMATDLFMRNLSGTEYVMYGFLCILFRVSALFPAASLLSLITSQLLILVYVWLQF